MFLYRKQESHPKENEEENENVNLKYKFGNRNFWATGYYVSTVGINTATVQKYIREQDKQDQIEDSLSKKEYQDPFTGGK